MSRAAAHRNLAELLAVGLLLTACSSGDADGPVVTVTVPPSSATTPGGASTSTSGSASASASPSATPSPSVTALPGTCDSLLADFVVLQALGNITLAGETSFVVGVPDATIGRLSTINCRYGVTGAGAAAKTKIEIGVSLYATAAQAQTRVSATTADYTSRGATSSPVELAPVGGAPAVTAGYLTGAAGTGYDLPLLVAASDRRTVAVTVDPVAVTTPPARQAATTLAQLALQRTAV